MVGALDDLFDLGPWQKLAGQFLAASWLFYSGLRIESVAGNYFGEMPWLTFPLTVCWLLACTNAFNLIDGLDGLASGVGFFATVTMLLAALLQGNVEMQILTVPLAAALLAFLRYNFNPASIFLGDSGAMLIGFSLGTYGIIWSQKSATLIGFAAPVVALAFPIAETLISIVRRFLRGHPVFEADSGHIHHLLLERGFGPRQVAAMIYGVAAVSAGVSLVLAQPAIRDRGVILIAFCLLAWFAFQKLGTPSSPRLARFCSAAPFGVSSLPTFEFSDTRPGSRARGRLKTAGALPLRPFATWASGRSRSNRSTTMECLAARFWPNRATAGRLTLGVCGSHSISIRLPS